MKITVDDHGTIKIIECEKNESLLDAMKRHQIYIPAYCAGRGTCKKCRIQLLEGTLPITEADRKAFDEEALARGCVCHARLTRRRNASLRCAQTARLPLRY